MNTYDSNCYLFSSYTTAFMWAAGSDCNNVDETNTVHTDLQRSLCTVKHIWPLSLVTVKAPYWTEYKLCVLGCWHPVAASPPFISSTEELGVESIAV